MSDAEVNLSIPAESRFVALARLAAAGVASEFDFSADAIEDLSVGVGELVACLVEWAEGHDGARLVLVVRAGRDLLEVEAEVGGTMEPTDPTPDAHDLDELTRRILAAVVDEHEISAGRGRLVKRRAGA